GNWGRRVDRRLAELDNVKYYPSPTMQGRTCQLPIVGTIAGTIVGDPKSKYRFQHRIDGLLREVRTGREDLLFFAACRMRELIAQGQIKPEVAVKLLESAWRGERGAGRRTIAAAFLTVEDGGHYGQGSSC